MRKKFVSKVLMLVSTMALLSGCAAAPNGAVSGTVNGVLLLLLQLPRRALSLPMGTGRMWLRSLKKNSPGIQSMYSCLSVTA